MSDEDAGRIESYTQKTIEMQDDFFGIEVDRYRPALGTAHLRRTAIASDSLEYAIKGISDGEASNIYSGVFPKQIPAAEWLCTKLAQRCGLPTPQCNVIKDPSTNEYFFGSRYDLAASSTPVQITEFISALQDSPPLLRKQLWAIYAYDQFVFNIDRHLGNYLYTKNREGNMTVQAFDFSLAAMVMGWPNKTDSGLLPATCNTAKNWIGIKALTSSDSSCKDSALLVLDKLDRIHDNTISSIFSEMPESWVNPLQRDALLAWWSSQEKMIRVNAIRNEVSK
ncbi:Uncharacterized protein related to capsule biosynthesis enzymes [Serratia ficaria]|uniref:HipA domain-containing protein n=1 Tax=Serratia ficaria TaxID=61651 RepID=UPI0021797192|nr:HipA domain-containing protein [Serratia ficaria]CAI1604749.1 Uncharacterized protein related to capsule biosynthesis enzymes [Serratia ficaria]